MASVAIMRGGVHGLRNAYVGLAVAVAIAVVGGMSALMERQAEASFAVDGVETTARVVKVRQSHRVLNTDGPRRRGRSQSRYVTVSYTDGVGDRHEVEHKLSRRRVRELQVREGAQVPLTYLSRDPETSYIGTGEYPSDAPLYALFALLGAGVAGFMFMRLGQEAD